MISIRKALLAAAALAATATPLAASAQPNQIRHDRQHVRQEQRQLQHARQNGNYARVQRERQDVRQARREVRQDRRQIQRQQRWRAGAFNAPFRYRSYGVGVVAPRSIYTPRYYVNNYARYRLPAVHGALRYVRHYNDLLLLNVRSGRVIRVYRNFYR